jgi:Cysteine-rich secretory protein family
VTYDPKISQDLISFLRSKILHFLQMVNDKSTKVGCAVMRYPNPDKDNFKTSYVVCDYSYGNICGLPSYVKGDQCSGCTTGCSTQYAGLCTKKEKVDFYADMPMIQYW